jgi:hypothetical protein
MLTPPDEMMTPATRALARAIRETDLRDAQN